MCLGVGDGYVVKKIEVVPGASLSLQMHKHRREHWLVVQGMAMVTVGEDIVCLAAGQSVDIPVETKHRLENKSNNLVEVIEIQMGQILDENDIVRFEDVYNRI